MKVEMTHNEYQEFLNNNANRLYTDSNYTIEDYARDAHNVVIKGFDLNKFPLTDEMKELINSMFKSDRISRMGNLLLDGFLPSNTGIYSLAATLGCKIVCDNGLSGFFRNDKERFLLKFCEGDLYLEICETDMDYKKALDSSCEFYKKSPVPFEVKIFDEESFDYDKARIGDIVTQRVVDIAMNSLPPVSMLSDCAQPGGAWSMREDPDTGKLRDTYATFKRITSGENGLWKFCGDCFVGENTIRGNVPDFIKGAEKEQKQDLNAKISGAQERIESQEALEYKGYKLRKANDGSVYPFKARPYDEANYYYAKSLDEQHWTIGHKGKPHSEVIGSFQDIVDRLEDLNKDIRPQMCHM